jgi:O-antigen ligase
MASEDRIAEYEPLRAPSRGPGAREFEPVRPAAPARAAQAGGADGDDLFGRHARAAADAGPADEAGASVLDRDGRAEGGAGVVGSDAAAAAAEGDKRRAKGVEVWSPRRGHGATFALLFAFTLVLFFRPYEFLPLPVQLAFWIGLLALAVFVPSQLAAEGTLTARPREVTLVALFVLTALLSLPLATSRADAWASFHQQFLKAVLIFVIFVNAVRTERRWHALMWLTLAVSFYLSVGALNDYRLGRFSVEGYRVGGRVGGLFGGANEMALHLVTVIPIAVGLFWGERGPLRKLIYGAGAVLMTAAAVVSYSRGAFLGLLAAVGVLGWKLGRRHRLAVVVLVVVGLVGFAALAPGGYGTRVLSIFDSSLDPNASSSMRRDVLWRSLFVAVHNPAFGVGIGNFPIMSIRMLESHNAYTQVAAEMGVAALVIYVLFIVTPLRRLARIERETFQSRRASKFHYRAIGLQAGLVAYMVSSFFASVAYQWYIYYLVGYAVTLRRLYAAEIEAAAAADTTPETADGLNHESRPAVDSRLVEGAHGERVSA